ncbi:hypothetical protein PIB30_085492 [Stylosanthes scabra]|uniref:Uncharacterized protein n=1 Tax=Stylosanthes scabra TaxID=79078 RepID=A0ABU6ZRG6_9FABA|nr:hypothetical protein [Stylosanthes scabra]
MGLNLSNSAANSIAWDRISPGWLGEPPEAKRAASDFLDVFGTCCTAHTRNTPPPRVRALSLWPFPLYAATTSLMLLINMLEKPILSAKTPTKHTANQFTAKRHISLDVLQKMTPITGCAAAEITNMSHGTEFLT